MCEQIKTVQAIVALLESYKHENYYKSSRQKIYKAIRDQYGTNNSCEYGNNQNQDSKPLISISRQLTICKIKMVKICITTVKEF